jgi:hypothetical protein
LALEYGLASLIYNALKDLLRWIISRSSKLTSAQVIEMRQKWKNEIEKNLRWIDNVVGYGEVIIRDVRRVDLYPDVDGKTKGISPWFRVGLLGTYHRGLQVGLKFEGLKNEESKGWRYYDYKTGEEPDLNACLVGLIPFERIVSIDWDGDDYYSIPHVYCHFASKAREPYEDLIFCEKRGTDRSTYYLKIAKYHDVRELSRKLKKGHYT